jgi:hypothetical protein
MSAETDSEISLKDTSDLQRDLTTLRHLGDLEREGHHAHALIEEIADGNETLAESIEALGTGTPKEPAETSENPGGTPCEEDENDCYKRVKSYGPVRTYNERYSRWLLTGKLF